MKRPRPNRRKQPRRELPRLPKLPRVAVNVRALFAVVAMAVVLALAVSLGQELLDLPVRRLEIQGPFQRVSSLQVQAAAQAALGGGMVSVDLDAVRARIEDITWVDRVRVQRIWPDTLLIAVTEHRAAARWGETGLLNTRGELFAEDDQQEYRELPKLAGPDGSHWRVANRYLRVREHLASTNLILDSIRMDARGAFTIEFAGGLTVRIGREDVDARIDRFFDVAIQRLLGDIDAVSYVDMRYVNGFAVGWREPVARGSALARLDAGG